LTLAPIQELTPEELAPFKHVLLAHLRSINPQMRQQVDSNLHVTKGERVPAYLFTLHVLLEIRDAKPDRVAKPYSDEEAQKIAPPGLLPLEPPSGTDVWNYPSEARPDFSPHRGVYFLPGTLQVEDCRDCHQRGEMACKQCLGKGEESCPSCLGAGSAPCHHCKGQEKTSCIRCGGEGRMASSAVGGRSARCDACGGSGKFPCTHCQGGKTPCVACRTSGKSTCRKCEGKGKTICSVCGGKKKVIVGQAFHAEFRPFQVQSAALAAVAPRDALDMALSIIKNAGSAVLEERESLEKQVLAAQVPVPVRAALMQLVEREKGKLILGSRSVKYLLELAEGGAVRLSGYCAGQEFAFWMAPGKTQVITERDPVASLGNAVAVAAEEAQVSGRWRKAVILAKETLSYSPEHPGAQEIISSWWKKVVRETFLGGTLLSAAVIAAHTAWIFGLERGLHKAGAAVKIGLLLAGLGMAACVALIPALVHIYSFRRRAPVLAVFLLTLLAGGLATLRWGLEWNPLRDADQAALDAEISGNFKYGFPEVYYDPDLQFLRALNEKYKESQADLGRLAGAIDYQLSLKAKHEKAQAAFDERIRGIVVSDRTPEEKRALIAAARDKGRLINLDVSGVENALKQVQLQEHLEGLKKNERKSRISIKPVEKLKPPSPPKKSAPPAKKSSRK
jgi:hypothetical protein